MISTAMFVRFRSPPLIPRLEAFPGTSHRYPCNYALTPSNPHHRQHTAPPLSAGAATTSSSYLSVPHPAILHESHSGRAMSGQHTNLSICRLHESHHNHDVFHSLHADGMKFSVQSNFAQASLKQYVYCVPEGGLHEGKFASPVPFWLVMLSYPAGGLPPP